MIRNDQLPHIVTIKHHTHFYLSVAIDEWEDLHKACTHSFERSRLIRSEKYHFWLDFNNIATPNEIGRIHLHFQMGKEKVHLLFSYICMNCIAVFMNNVCHLEKYGCFWAMSYSTCSQYDELVRTTRSNVIHFTLSHP